MVDSFDFDAAQDAAISCAWGAYWLPMRIVSCWRGCADESSGEALDAFQRQAAERFGELAAECQLARGLLTPELLDSLVVANAQAGNLPTVEIGGERYTTWHQATVAHATRLVGVVVEQTADYGLLDLWTAGKWDRIGEALSRCAGPGRWDYWRRVRDAVVMRPGIDPQESQARIEQEAANVKTLIGTPQIDRATDNRLVIEGTTVTFFDRGQRLAPITVTLGARYIAALVRSPGEKFTTKELEARIGKAALGGKAVSDVQAVWNRSHGDEGEVVTLNRGHGTESTSEEIIDREAHRTTLTAQKENEARRKELATEIEALREQGASYDEVEEREEELKRLESNAAQFKSYLADATFKGHRKQAGKGRSAQQAIVNAITRVLEKLAAENGSDADCLGGRLRRQITMGAEFFYTPGPGESPWSVEC